MTTLITPTAERSRRTVRLRSWQTAAGLAAIAAGAAIVTGTLLPWVETFAGLIGIPGIRGTNGRLLAAAGVLIAAAGIYHLVRGGQAARWLTGIAGFAALGFSVYLLIQLTRSMSVLGGDSMVVARGGPGLWVAAGGSATAFATLFLPPSSQRTLRRPEATGATLAWAADRDAADLRRGLQIALGLVWLLDAALQYQPYMFSRNFVTSVLEPAEYGQPSAAGLPRPRRRGSSRTTWWRGTPRSPPFSSRWPPGCCGGVPPARRCTPPLGGPSRCAAGRKGRRRGVRDGGDGQSADRAPVPPSCTPCSRCSSCPAGWPPARWPVPVLAPAPASRAEACWASAGRGRPG